MTKQERATIKEAKIAHKVAKSNKSMYKNSRDIILRTILDCEIPRWGGLKIKVEPIM